MLYLWPARTQYENVQKPSPSIVVEQAILWLSRLWLLCDDTLFYLFYLMFLCGVLLAVLVLVLLFRSDLHCWCKQVLVDAHGYRSAMNLPYCVPIIVCNTVQPDAPQLDRLLEIWKENAASHKNDRCLYSVSKRRITVKVKWSLEVFMFTSFIGRPWSNV